MNQLRSRLNQRTVAKAVVLLLAAGLFTGNSISPIHAQPSTQAAATRLSGNPSRYKPNRVPKRAGEYYGIVWGVEALSVKAVESGALIRFSYRIVDPRKAKLLNDKKTEAFLEAPSAHARLSIPSLEKVGQLRQGTPEEVGKSYWMAFSNPRRTVKAGDHVNVVIGRFQAENLVVE